MLAPGASFPAFCPGAPAAPAAPSFSVSVPAQDVPVPGVQASSPRTVAPQVPFFSVSGPGPLSAWDVSGAVPRLLGWTSLPSWDGPVPLPSMEADLASSAGAGTLKVSVPARTVVFSGAAEFSLRQARGPSLVWVEDAGQPVDDAGPVAFSVAADGASAVSFSGCAGLTSVSGVSVLREGLFEGCSSLAGVGGAKWSSFPARAFRGCAALAECPVEYDAADASLGARCFDGCSSMPNNTSQDGGIVRVRTVAQVGEDCLCGCVGVGALSCSHGTGSVDTPVDALASRSGLHKAAGGSVRSDTPSFYVNNHLAEYRDGVWTVVF